MKSLSDKTVTQKPARQPDGENNYLSYFSVLLLPTWAIENEFGLETAGR